MRAGQRAAAEMRACADGFLTPPQKMRPAGPGTARQQLRMALQVGLSGVVKCATRHNLLHVRSVPRWHNSNCMCLPLVACLLAMVSTVQHVMAVRLDGWQAGLSVMCSSSFAMQVLRPDPSRRQEPHKC